MKTFTMIVTKRDSFVTYTEILRYNIKDNILTMERGDNQKFIVPLRYVVEIEVEKIETKDVPNGEFAGGE